MTPKAEEDVDGALTDFASADNTDLFAAHVKTGHTIRTK